MLEILLNNFEINFTIILYITILILVSLFSYVVEKSKHQETKLLFRFLVFMVYLIPAILRYDIGADYSSYETAYNMNNNYFKEIGYVWLCEILHFFGKNSWHLFFWMAVLTYFPLAFLIKDKYFYIQITYVLFMSYLKSYDVIRQALALPYLILSFQNMKNKKYFCCMLDITIATLFHFSSLSILMVYICSLLIKSEKVQKVIFVLLLISVISGFLKMILFNIIENYIPTYFHYLETMYGQNAELGSGFGIILAVFLPFIFVIMKNRQKKDNTIMWSTILFIVFRLAAIQFAILGRIADVLWSGAIYTYTYIDSYDTKYRKIIIYIFYVIGILLFLRWITGQTGPGTSEITPYISIFGDR